MRTIDLGEVTRGTVVPVPGPRLDLRLARRFALAAMVLLTVLTATGSARPEPRGVRPLWTTPFRDGDALYTTDTMAYVGRTAAGGATLTAYDLATGKLRWTAPTGETVTNLTPAGAAGMLLIPDAFADVRRRLADGSNLVSVVITGTAGRDAGTGELLWRGPGEALEVDDATTLLGDHDDQGGVTRLRLVRLRDGGTIWTRETPGLQEWAISTIAGRPAELITATGRGELTILRYADGTLLRTGRVPWVTGQAEAGVYAVLTTTPGHLLVTRSLADGRVTTVYRLDDLAELWHTGGDVADCGPVICVLDGITLNGRDPATGARRWHLPGIGGVSWAGDDRVLAASARQDGSYRVVDAATGRPVGDAVSGFGTWVGQPGRSVLLLRDTAETPPRSAVIRLDLATGAQFLMGAVRRTGQFGCAGVRAYLVCLNGRELDVTAVG